MLKPGFAWGGNCFPRDTQSLIDTYLENGVDAPILQAALALNDARLLEPYEALREKHVDGGRVLVLGLAYKSGVNITSGSKSVQLLKYLQEKGYDAVGYDPNLNTETKCDVSGVTYDVVIVTTDEPCFENILNEAGKRNPNLLILDYRMSKVFSMETL